MFRIALLHSYSIDIQMKLDILDIFKSETGRKLPTTAELSKALQISHGFPSALSFSCKSRAVK